MLLAPFNMHSRMLELLAQVEAAALAGYKTARIVIKINALTDAELIHGLLRAGQCRRQGRPDRAWRLHAAARACPVHQRQRIVVRSVVGRFLEHTRVLLLPLGLADGGRRWRGALPVERRLDEPQHVPPHRGGLAGERRPSCASASSTRRCSPTCTTAIDAWQLGPDGRSVRVDVNGGGVSAQQALMRRYSE